MRSIVGLVAILGLVSGLVGAFAYDQLGSNAGAAPPPPAPPSPTRVREQNLDTSGLIRVHEQGTANVAGTINVGNLPAVQDVNVVSPPAAPQGRLISLTFTDSLSQFADVSGCGNVSILARTTTAGDFAVGLFSSPDGTTRILRGDSYATLGSADGVRTALAKNLPVAEPFLQLQIQAPNPTAWIWCQP